MDKFLGALKNMLVDNWKTTGTGLVAGLAVILSSYGIHITDAAQDNFVSLITAAGLMVLGIFSKDGGGQ